MKWIQENGLTVLAMVLVVGALAPIPYNAYYQIMNWAVAGAALLTALRAHRMGTVWAVWLYGAVAVLFNPVAPIYLTAATWQILDVLVALVLAASFLVLKK